LRITSDLSVRSAKLGEHPVAGAPGLFLRVRVTANGSFARGWIVRVSVNARRARFGLGSYPDVTLAEARGKAQDARRAVAEGKDPSVSAKRRQRASESHRTLMLGQAIDDWLASVARSYKNPKSTAIRERALRVHFAPLHYRDAASITVADVAGILRTLAPETASKAHAAIRAVFDYVAAALEPHGVMIANPADPRRLRSLGWSPKSRSDNKPHAAVDWRVMPEVVDELSRMDGAVATCMLFIAATAVRAGTARLAKWSDIDLAKREWTPPLADLKDSKHHKRPFIAPLNDVAIAALERARARASSRYVFANSAGSPISDKDLTKLIRHLRRRHDDWRDPHSGNPFTVHGFRSAFRTWAEETRRVDGALAELVLGHKVHGDVATRYIRTGLVEERRALLDAWSRHLCSESAKIITLRTG
jgi:integrase